MITRVLLQLPLLPTGTKPRAAAAAAQVEAPTLGFLSPLLLFTGPGDAAG